MNDEVHECQWLDKAADARLKVRLRVMARALELSEESLAESDKRTEAIWNIVAKAEKAGEIPSVVGNEIRRALR